MKINSHQELLLQRAMLRANKLSLQGSGQTAPNPIVGAVILDSDGAEIASGFHAGGDHAEIVAIRSAQKIGVQDFSHSTLVVTLEPCNHHGKTPPCSTAIIAAKFARVVFAIKDPNPIASGGAETLRKAGIEVIEGIEREYVSYCNRAWLKKVRTGLPWIVTKIAATLDGKIAAADGSSKWITSEDARTDVAHLRNESDAIVTTTETVLRDNPELTPRFAKANPTNRVNNPVRIVMGEREIPSDATINNNRAETRYINSRSLETLIDSLREEKWNQVMIEAGATFNSALLAANLVDEIVLYQAPTLLGKGRNFAEGLEITSLLQRHDMAYGEIRRVGKDLRIQLLSNEDTSAFLFASKQVSQGVR